MRPPDDMGEYFRGEREDALERFDQPGGLFRLARWKRLLLASMSFCLVMGLAAAVYFTDEKMEPVANWIALALTGALFAPFVVLFVWNPRKLVGFIYRGVFPRAQPNSKTGPAREETNEVDGH